MAEATGLRNNALNYPIYGAPFGIVFPVLDADGDLVTGAASLDSEVSKNGNTFADCTNEATEIATSSGMYYLLLTGTELTADVVTGITKTSTSGAKTTSWSLYPRKLVTVRSGTAAGGDTGYITLDANASAVDDFYNGMVCIATIDSNLEVRVITDYTGSNKQAAVTPEWNVTPDSDDTFVIKLPEGAQIPTVNVTLWKGAAAQDMTGDAYAVVAHADHGNAKLVRSTTPANTLTVDASHQALALTNAVTNDAITAAAIANGAIDAATFAAGAITATVIATGAIDADAIAYGAIDNGALAADAISAAKIAADVTTELQSGLATSAELAKVPKSDSNVTWNATALASINAEVDTALNTAIPGAPTADSINERVATMDGRILGTLAAGTHSPQTGDAYAIVNHADYGNAKLVRSTTPANTLDVSATGEAGLDFNNIKDATGAHTLTNITVPVVTSVAANGITATSIAADAINAAAVKADAVTKIQAGLATPTNITAGTITTVTNLTNAPTAGDFTATMKTSAQTAANAALVANNLDHLLKTAVADKNNLGDAGGNEVVTSTIMSLMLSKTDDADSFVYTTDSLEARADLGATAAELAKVPKSDSNVTWNATALASIQAEATDALNAYDPPTNAELEARTLVAASYFDPATDKVTLATTQGAITWAQQKIAASVTGEGALHITNADAAGFGTYAAGGQAGAYNKGTDAAGYGEYNEGPTYGQINYGTGAASYGQRNLGMVNDTQGDISGNITGNLSGSVGSVTGAVGSVTSGVALADDAITAAKFDETTAYPLKSADTGATAVARTGADADTLETLSDQLDDVPTVAEFEARTIAAADYVVVGDTLAAVTTVGSVTGAVGSVTGAVGSVTGNVGGNVAGSVASVTGNVGGNVVGSVGSVTGAVGSVTGNVGGNVTGSVGSVAAGGITAASIATGAIDADALAADAGAELADAVWDEALAGHAGAGTAGAALSAASAPTAADVADAVWDEALAGHAGAGSAGAALSAAGAAGDPWSTALPGAYAAGTAGDIIGNLVTDIGALTPAVAISTTTAASVSTGALAVRTHHSLSQTISSTYAGNLSAATKLWLAVKAEKDDTDAQAVIFIEATAGLTYLAGAAYTTVAHGSLTVGGVAGAWTITVAIDEVATGLLTAYADGMLWAECKALVGGSTVAVWDGVCDVARGIVNATS